MKYSRYSFVGALVLGSSLFVGCGAVPPSPSAPVATDSPSTSSGEKAPPKDGMGAMKQEAPPELTEEQKAQLNASSTTSKPAERTFTVAAGSYYFVPNVIRVKKGDTVKIVLENKGGMHNFVLDEFNVKIDAIRTGESAIGQFVADKAGTYEYYCGIGSHRKMGQKGTLIVE